MSWAFDALEFIRKGKRKEALGRCEGDRCLPSRWKGRGSRSCVSGDERLVGDRA